MSPTSLRSSAENPIAAPSGASSEPGPAGDPTLVLDSLQRALAGRVWPDGAADVVSDLSRRLGCLRVSLGWVISSHLKVVALSDGAVVEEGAAIPELNQAMLEAVHQQCTLTWPSSARRAQRITLAHQSLHRVQGLGGVLSVPLAHRGEVVGVLTLERSRASGPLGAGAAMSLDGSDGHFEREDIECVEQLAQALAPLLLLQYRLDRPWHARWLGSVRRGWSHLREPQGRAWRWGLSGLALALAAALMVPAPVTVTSPARLEGAVQRVIGAAQDGYLREVHVRPGDVVKQGQPLLALSDDELQASRRARAAEMAQQENAFAEAFARNDRAAAAQAQARLAESRAQLELVEQQLSRVQVVAPFDGVVIAGDLHPRLGAPVKRGDMLLTLAPGLDWRVMLEVAESDVADLRIGQTAVLRLSAMPSRPIALTLDRITPVAHATADGVRYEVEARPTGLNSGDTHLRPGLEGVARIEMPARPLLWRWAEQAWRWLAMAWWTWL